MQSNEMLVDSQIILQSRAWTIDYFSKHVVWVLDKKNTSVIINEE